MRIKKMIDLNRTLKFFCKTHNFEIKSIIEHSNDYQYEILDKSDSIYVTIYTNKSVLVQGKESDLKQLFLLWANKDSNLPSVPNQCSYVIFSLEWKEWKEDAHILHNIFKESQSEDILNDPHYFHLRGRLFHDYMFRKKMGCTIELKQCIELIKSWFDKNCFQNIPEDLFFNDFYRQIFQYSFDNDLIPLDIIGESLSYAMGNYCPKKMCKYKSVYGCSQMGTDNTACIFNLVDYLYPYSNAKGVVAFNKSNLQILTGLKEGDIKWKSFEPTTPIEEIMDKNLRDAKFPIIPQFQAYSNMHKYRLDFLLETNCQYKIGVECDGLEYHAKPGQYIKDRQRDRYLQEHNILLLRYSSHEIFNNINNCIEEIDQYFWKIKKDLIEPGKAYRTNYFGLD